MHSEEVVCLMPLSQYKRNELYKHVESFELADPKMFEDAVITENICICEVKKAEVNKFSWNDLRLYGLDQKYIDFYRWNISNTKGITMERKDSKQDIPFSWCRLDTDFVETGRCCASAGGAGFGPDGYGYRWNVTKQNTNTEWLHCAGVIRFKSKKEKDNFAKYWYNGGKFKSLAGKVCIGTNMVSISADYYFFIPQIDWEAISDHELWKKGMYDEAVLDTMNLKWNEEKTCIVKK